MFWPTMNATEPKTLWDSKPISALSDGLLGKGSPVSELLQRLLKYYSG